MERRTSLTAALALALLLTAAVPATAAPDTVGLVDPAAGSWQLRNEAGWTADFYFGNPGDDPFMGDWDCDGVDTPGLHRPSDGYVYLRNSNDSGVADVDFFFGNPGDIALPGDFDGDCYDTVSIYRPSEGRVYIVNQLGDGASGLGPADFSYYFGNPGDDPFVGDFDGDGIDEIGLHRVSTGFVYFRNTHTPGIADDQFFYGDPGDHILAGNWQDGGVDTVGIFRPSDSAFYLRHSNSAGNADEAFVYGSGSWLPVSGAFGQIDAQPDLALVQIASGLASPTFAGAPLGDDRLFVTELEGRIMIVDNGQVLPQPFLDITNLVDGSGERGLFAMAFHPSYAVNGRFYVNYIDNAGDTQIAEFTVSAGDPNLADAGSYRPVLDFAQPASNHNGGMLEFGPDGYLYIASGDGGGQHDPNQNGQDPNTLLGTMLRIDVDGAQPYAVPGDNPFVGGGGAPEVWAYGLRNPWRFSIDDTEGLMYIGDVGQDAWEEVDVVPTSTGGYNFGWDVLEGNACHEPATGCSLPGATPPTLAYPLSGGNCSVIGGFAYRGSAIGGYQGHYFYADLCGGWVRSFRYLNGTVTSERDYSAEFGGLGQIWSFGEDGHRELYVVTSSGRIYKIVPA